MIRRTSPVLAENSTLKCPYKWCCWPVNVRCSALVDQPAGQPSGQDPGRLPDPEPQQPSLGRGPWGQYLWPFTATWLPEMAPSLVWTSFCAASRPVISKPCMSRRLARNSRDLAYMGGVPGSGCRLAICTGCRAAMNLMHPIQVPLQQIRAASWNPTQMGDAMAVRLRRSIQRFGLLVPLVVREIDDLIPTYPSWTGPTSGCRR